VWLTSIRGVWLRVGEPYKRVSPSVEGLFFLIRRSLGLRAWAGKTSRKLGGGYIIWRLSQDPGSSKYQLAAEHQDCENFHEHASRFGG